MAICDVCGRMTGPRAEATASVDPIWVESNVLAGCNAAYERALRRGAAEVALLDLLHAIASAPTLAAWLAAYDIDGDLLRIEIEAEQGDIGTSQDDGRTPRTSIEMKDALGAARDEAARRLAFSLTIGDVLTAVLDGALGAGSRILAAHVARERQRRRGGGRGWRADQVGGLGALGSGAAGSTWEAEGMAGAYAVAASVADYDGGRDEAFFNDRPEARNRAGFPTASLHDRPAADETYRSLDDIDPLDRRARANDDGGGRGEDDAIADALNETYDSDPPGEADRAQAGRELWREDILACLEAQAMQLVSLREQLQAMQDGRREKIGVGEADEQPAPDAKAISSSAETASAVVRVREETAKVSSSARERHEGRVVGSLRLILTRDAIRAEMRRTAKKRQQLRASRATAMAAAAAAAAGFGDQASASLDRLQAISGRAGDAGSRPQLRMAVPGPGSASRTGQGKPMPQPRIADRPIGRGGDEGYSRPDDDDADDLEGGHRPKRFYLSMGDDIVDAPSIGPKTAERLREHGINTVRNLLAVKAHVLSARVGVRHITAERIASWQHQARLVCTIPWLRGTHAQILVGSGYYAPHSIVTANRDALCTAILRFATTREGQSVLRSSPPPSLGKIMRWVEQAAMAELDRAA